LGELAVIYDRNDRFLAIGLYDPDSPLRVRVLHCGKPQTIDAAWWQKRLRTALDLRQPLFASQTTTGYRLINGESDGWPGLVLDRYGHVLVLKLYTAAWLVRLKEVVSLLGEEIQCDSIVLRLSRNIQSAARKAGHVEGNVLAGEPVSGPVIFTESGLQFEADVLRGQKTGFFLDQRENRQLVGALAKRREILNAFSFTGGFSLYAARGGADAVTDLDISAHALEGAKRNFKLNADLGGVSACQHDTIQADVFEWLTCKQQPRFDMVILDPPSLARREVERERALQAYANLARGGAMLLKPEGILMAASCSAHVSADEFFATVTTALSKTGKRVEEIQRTTHAIDHPATFPEARYLKGICLRVR
jgi:23S rRNA (cytosine1962-C5)-methyltransferase